jgi:MSHA pilin protein MshA
MKANNGFTLIELVMVIVILGILAATAVPKFISITSDANLATLQALKGSLSSSSAMFHSKALINNISLDEAHNISSAEINGTDISYGYPYLSYFGGNISDLETVVNINGDEWFAMGGLSINSFFVTLDTLAELRPAPNDDPSARRVVDIIDSGCYITYVNAAKLPSGQIEPPVITLIATGDGC